MTPRRVPVLTCSLVLAAAVLGGCTDDEGTPQRRRTPDAGTLTATWGPTTAVETSSTAIPSTTQPTTPHKVRVAGTVATDLEVPWGLDFLPDGRALVTQRNRGTISVIDGGRVRQVGAIPETTPTSEGGLLGLAVSPDFARDREILVYVTTGSDNRVLAMRFEGGKISDVHPILTGIPAGSIHDGGQLEFGPDGSLYVSTGETGSGDLAQDRGSLGGKILRITTEGDPAPGNPDPDSPIWTLGHRNVQGLAFDDEGRLWASEFGSQVWDELNLVERGNNYGWPAAEGNADLEGMTDPLVQWHPEEASPSSVAYADGAVWVASLRGQRLWEVPIHADGTVGKPIDHFVGEYGRLRRVTAAPDGSLWLTTSNRDGRGFPQPGDDRILRITLH